MAHKDIANILNIFLNQNELESLVYNIDFDKVRTPDNTKDLNQYQCDVFNECIQALADALQLKFGSQILQKKKKRRLNNENNNNNNDNDIGIDYSSDDEKVLEYITVGNDDVNANAINNANTNPNENANANTNPNENTNTNANTNENENNTGNINENNNNSDNEMNYNLIKD